MAGSGSSVGGRCEVGLVGGGRLAPYKQVGYGRLKPLPHPLIISIKLL